MNRTLTAGGTVSLALAVFLAARTGSPREGAPGIASNGRPSASSSTLRTISVPGEKGQDSIETFLAALDHALAHPELPSHDEWLRLQNTGFALRAELSLDMVLARMPIFEAWNDPKVPGMYWVAHCFYRRWGELDPINAWARTWPRVSTPPGVIYPSEPIHAILMGWSEIDAKAAVAHYLIAIRANDEGEVDFRVILQDPLMQNWARQNPDEAMDAMINSEAPRDIENYLRGVARLDSISNQVDRLERYLARWGETREGDSPEQHPHYRSYCEKIFAVVWAHEDPAAALRWHASRVRASPADHDSEEAVFEGAFHIIDRLMNENQQRAERWLREECHDERMIAGIAAKQVWDRPLFLELAARLSSPADRLMVAKAIVEGWNEMLPSFPSDPSVPIGDDSWSEARIAAFLRQSRLGSQQAEQLVARIQQRRGLSERE